MKTIKHLLNGLLIFLLLLVASCSQHKVFRFGICADVHKDVMHDADQRLQAFVSEMNEKDVDFIVELGDFTQPQDYNASFLNIWNSFEGSSFHVPGNHDMDNDTGDRYSHEIDEQYPYIKYTAPYKDPIFATVEIDSRGIIRIMGRESNWVGPDPWELGYPEGDRNKTVPRITSRELEF